MPLTDKESLIRNIAPPADEPLTRALLDEFISLERRFIQRDWGPAELDGGRFAEILARIIYHMDSNTLSPGKEFNECISYVEDMSSKNRHHSADRRSLIHISKALRVIYKFRSERGGIHVSLKYTPNHMDSKLIIECARWCMNETLRLLWQGADKEMLAKAIRELLQFDVPCIGKFEDVLLVQRTDLSSEEEILVLLHYAGEQGFSRNEIGKHCKASASSITRGLQNLISPNERKITLINGKNYVLIDLGHKHIRENLSEKLLLS
jgi:hypothetical protein